MKRSVMDYLRIAQFPVIIAFGTLPFPIVALGYLAPELLGYAWTLPIGYLVLSLCSFFVPGKLRPVYSIIGAVAIVLPWALTVTGPSLAVGLLAAMIYAVLLCWSTRIGGWSSNQELHSAWLGVCIGIQLVGQLLYYIDSYSDVPALGSVSGWFVVSFFAMIVLIMMSMNRNALNTITAKRPKTALLIRRKNVLLVLALFGLAILFSLIPSAAGLLSALYDLIAGAFKTDSEIPIETRPVINPGMQKPDFGIELNVGLHTDIMNALFMVVSVIVLIIAVPLIVYLVGKQLWNFLQGIWNMLVTNVINNMDEYDDEITDTRDSLIEEQAEASRTTRRGLFYNDRGMGAQERIRYRYKYLLRRHPEWLKGSTARENLPDETAAIYERARYSPHPITSEEADRFKAETKKI